MTLDNDKIDEAVLALLLLGRHDDVRAWKGFDWNALSRLHEKGYISDPRGKAKSVVLKKVSSKPSDYWQRCFLKQSNCIAQSRRKFSSCSSGTRRRCPARRAVVEAKNQSRRKTDFFVGKNAT